MYDQRSINWECKQPLTVIYITDECDCWVHIENVSIFILSTVPNSNNIIIKSIDFREKWCSFWITYLQSYLFYNKILVINNTSDFK